MGKNKAVFLDRDGVINKEINYLHTIEDFCFIDGVFESLKSFQSAGYRLIIVTNQAGIARGYYTEEQFHKLNSWMLDKFSKNGVHIDAVYYAHIIRSMESANIFATVMIGNQIRE